VLVQTKKLDTRMKKRQEHSHDSEGSLSIHACDVAWHLRDEKGLQPKHGEVGICEKPNRTGKMHNSIPTDPHSHIPMPKHIERRVKCHFTNARKAPVPYF